MYSAASLCTWVFSSQAVSQCCRHRAEGDSGSTLSRAVPTPQTPVTLSSQGKHRLLQENWGWAPGDGLILEQLEFCTGTDCSPNVQLAPLMPSPRTSRGCSWHSSSSLQPLPSAEAAPLFQPTGMQFALSPGLHGADATQMFQAQPIAGFAVPVQCFPCLLLCPSARAPLPFLDSHGCAGGYPRAPPASALHTWLPRTSWNLAPTSQQPHFL